MGIARHLPFVLLFVPLLALGKQSGTFKRTVADAEVDWSEGTITVQAGSAADLRMPGPNSARPGAERRARVFAEEKLRAALTSVVGGAARVAKVEAKLDETQALAHATVTRTEYQSDGGVVLWLTLRFADVVAAKPATVALKVGSMPFEFAPAIVGPGEQPATGRLGFATYRPAADSPPGTVRVERDGKGRLRLPPAAGDADSLAGRSVVIYVEKAP
jgi:hypothetical protein